MNPRVCILRTDGTNCDEETAHAFQNAGGTTDLVHVNQLRGQERSLQDYEILAIPGGFSYGDDVASGKILAVELITFLEEELRGFVEKGRPVIGICNGFQVLVRTGLLPFKTMGKMQATLTHNDSGRFECRWTSLSVSPSPCIFTAGMSHQELSLMVAHGEGKFFSSPETMLRLEEEGLIVLRYIDPRTHLTTEEYPLNPNGSTYGIAGICDPTGLIFGLMPHPERFVDIMQHPNWRRFPSAPHGLPIFENAVRFAKQL